MAELFEGKPIDIIKNFLFVPLMALPVIIICITAPFKALVYCIKVLGGPESRAKLKLKKLIEER